MLRLAASALLFVLLLIAPPGYAVEPAGTVVRLLGNSIAAMNTGFSRPLYLGSTILVGDRIETTSGARIQLRMNDGSEITLGENSSMVVDLYGKVDEQGVGILKMASGVFLAVSGALAKLGPDHFVVETPSAILGVRGTEVWGRVGDDNRVEIALLSGTAVSVTTPEGKVEMTQPNSGITVVPGQVPPQPRPWADERLAAARAAVSFDLQ